LFGAPALFTGDAPSGAGATFPLILITLFGSFTAFEVIVTFLLIAPALFVSYFTEITPLAPGAIGSFGQDGTVQPQDHCALEIINGAFPVLVNSKVQVPFAPFLMFP
jgi:hypothetical protein